ncbi:hypothetical protein FOMG_19944 [Fusarium oxysporum f. sp. melonis 26406]|uniref:Uncharacterized protein n=1 Tax=Fusarium oxysporum f. sp. melonis 26406 TaxID=1089452 RepID=W9Z3R7_FUSOX|nr:hypothetical protein FOMG_19944 [Fusarium oxysporum f. sp. melonis 26406]
MMAIHMMRMSSLYIKNKSYEDVLLMNHKTHEGCSSSLA